MKKLVLGRIPADYSRATHILVDPGSVLGAEFAAPDLPGFPFPSSAENYAAARIATAEAKRRLPALAQRLNEMGVTAFVLKYRLPSDETMIQKEIGPIQDAQRALQLVRQRSAE